MAVDAVHPSRSEKQTVFGPEQQLYQSRSTQEDRARTNVHYEQPVEFFTTITGGEWHVYSCNLWEMSEDTTGDVVRSTAPHGDGKRPYGAHGERKAEQGVKVELDGAQADRAQADRAQVDTASQEAKLDLLAQLLDLRPGQRILDVGCGWGGPLVYLSRRYGVSGVGLTLSPTQQRAAQQRADRYGVDVQVHERHWRDFDAERGFDAVLTDEVIVHFSDLGGFFAKAYSLLHDGGRMLNKELHFTHRRYAQMTRAMSYVNEIYGSTGNYRTLAEELTLVGDAGFDVQTVHQIPRRHYQLTLSRWMANMQAHRAALEALVGADYYHRFRTYLNVVRHVLRGHTMTMDVVVAHKPAA
jgi:cyclopropane-fatty-acyl-phospholipid synthase